MLRLRPFYYSKLSLQTTRRPFAIHSTAFVHPDALISTSTIGPFAYVGPGVTIQEDTQVGPHCTLLNCDIGARVILHSGVRIGQDGFGFFPSATPAAGTPANDAAAAAATLPTKKPQELRVVIGKDVEIGANTAIDRGSWRDTVVHSGTKIDNLVQIGHNVEIGASCLIAAQTGIAGSTTIGERVLIGGQVGIAQHLTIGSGARIAAKSGVVSNVREHQTVGGYPAVDIGTFRRQAVEKRRKK